jgi:transposase
MISPGPDASVRPGSSRRCAARSTGAGGRRPSLRILRRLFTALADPTGVRANRPGALERVGFLLQDWQATADKLADTETRMTGVLDQLRLTDLATSIPGLSPVGATVILAETDDPTRFRHRPRPGQTCRPRATREAVRHLRRPHQTHRPRPPRAAPGRLAQPTRPGRHSGPRWTLNTLTEAAQADGIRVHRSQLRRILMAEKVRWRHTRSWATSDDPDFAPKECRSSGSTPTRRRGPR